MCGVAGAVGARAAERTWLMTSKLTHRGPDALDVWNTSDVALGHTRLSIIDLDARSDCPFVFEYVTLVYNGELWNYRELRHLMRESGTVFRTDGDTEVVAAVLNSYGRDGLEMLEGMFSVAWHDARDEQVYLARDRFGETPLHLAPTGDSYDASLFDDGVVADGFEFASELKAFDRPTRLRAVWVQPGECVRIGRLPTGRWKATSRRWYSAPAAPIRTTAEEAGETFRALMTAAVRERAIADVPVCTLLSGGIDSTAVAYHLRRHVPNLVAYTAVFDEKSQDARMSRLAADELGIELREVKVPLPSRADLKDVIRRIEMPFKAQVEIGWPCLHLARAMRADGFKVCFSGEGSDELWASYGFAYHVLQRTFGGRKEFGAPGAVYEPGREREWCEYRRDTFVGQHRKNFPRCNKIFMAHGVECRLPFLHTPLVEFALSVPVDACVVRAAGHGPTKQKAVMYSAYDGLVPERIVKRHKVAFQEGMGLKDAIAASFNGDNPKVFYTSAYKEEYA